MATRSSDLGFGLVGFLFCSFQARGHTSTTDKFHGRLLQHTPAVQTRTFFPTRQLGQKEATPIMASTSSPVLVPDGEYVQLEHDVSTDTWFLEHSFLGTTAKLPVGAWSSVPVDGGFLAVFDTSAETDPEDPGEVSQTSEWFSQILVADTEALAESQDHWQVLSFKWRGKEVRCTLPDARSECDCKTLDTEIGNIAARVSHRGARLMLPIHGQRWYWCLASLHAILHLEVGRKHHKASKSYWLSKRIGALEKWCLSLGFTASVLKGGLMKDSGQINPYERPCCSTVGLLACLSRWAFLPDNQGGFKAEKDKTAARSYLDALLHGCLLGTTLNLAFYWDAEHLHIKLGGAWKGTRASTLACVNAHVDVDHWTSSSVQCARRLHEVLRRKTVSCSRVPIATFLEALASCAIEGTPAQKKSAKWVLAQVLGRASEHCESLLDQIWRGRVQHHARFALRQ
eukprot:6482870-Amphidinium_carterae.1